MISTLGCSYYGEVSFDVMADIFMSRDSMVFMLSAVTSSIFFSIVVQSSDLAGSILPHTLILTLVFSIRSSNDVVIVEVCFSCSNRFDGGGGVLILLTPWYLLRGEVFLI